MLRQTSIRFYGLFVFLLFNNLIYGQLKYGYIKGSIELQNGQKVEGYIKNEEIAKMNYKVSFKKTEEDKEVTAYDTSQVRTVRLDDGEIFELLHIHGHYMTGYVSVMAKLIVSGKASLYEMYYDGDYGYIITNDGKSYVLQKDKFDRTSSSSTEVTQYHFKEYLGQAVAGGSIQNERIENLEFEEKDFRKIIMEYNKSKGSESQVSIDKNKARHFIILDGGGMIKNSKEKELFFQFIYRMYLPKISRNTSINIGLSYFNYKYGDLLENSSVKKYYTYNLYSAPLQIQQNLLNKNIRPYIFAGFNVSYLQQTDDRGNSVITKGFQSNFGIGLLAGGGIEAEIYKGLMLKTEYRYENFSHLVLVGIGFNFSKQ